MRGPHILIHAFLYFIYLFINYVNVNHGRVLLVLEKLIKMHFIAVDFYKLQKRKKTLSATPYFGKGDLRKIESGSRVRLLIGKVQ